MYVVKKYTTLSKEEIERRMASRKLDKEHAEKLKRENANTK